MKRGSLKGMRFYISGTGHLGTFITFFQITKGRHVAMPPMTIGAEKQHLDHLLLDILSSKLLESRRIDTYILLFEVALETKEKTCREPALALVPNIASGRVKF